MKETAVYVHIPFCDHKCIYCDFYSIVTYENKQSYLQSLLKEIDHYSQLYSGGRKIISIYFGGGTPSFMEQEYIGEIISSIKSKFILADKPEITLETNPGTVTKEKLKGFKLVGINRISIGIQSFNEDELKFLTRIHDSKTAIKTVNDASESGFENISIDLIFNLPKQTKEMWKRNLNEAAKLPIKHISAYSLILEHGTILNKMVLDGKVQMHDEDYDADLYETTIDFFDEKNFKQYEVSNFALSGFECIHNLAYWRYKDYLSFGTSAHSFIENKRWWNYSSVKFYNDAVEKNNHATAGSEILTQKQMLEEYVMLAFRSSGLELNNLAEKFSNRWFVENEDYISELIDQKFLVKRDSILRFTKKGYLLCDEIISNFK